VPVLVTHDRGCRYARPRDGGHSDAAKRVSDTVNLHLSAAGRMAYGQWIAVALADGASDNVLYASRRAAVSHQHHNEHYCAYIRLLPHAMSVCEAEAFLRMHRLAYDAGFRLSDPEAPGGGHEIIPRLTSEEYHAQISALQRRTWPVQRVIEETP
jgi:hypothetical protein